MKKSGLRVLNKGPMEYSIGCHASTEYSIKLIFFLKKFIKFVQIWSTLTKDSDGFKVRRNVRRPCLLFRSSRRHVRRPVRRSLFGSVFSVGIIKIFSSDYTCKNFVTKHCNIIIIPFHYTNNCITWLIPLDSNYVTVNQTLHNDFFGFM